MSLTFRDICPTDSRDGVLLARWNNDPALKFLINRFPTPESTAVRFQPEHFRYSRPPDAPPWGAYIVRLDDTPVGFATFELDTPKLLHREPCTAWFALMIGEPVGRGRGLGQEIMAALEARAAAAGAVRGEIGVFEHNHRALAFFQRLGYQEFTRLPRRTWVDETCHGEVRLEKMLPDVSGAGKRV